jgi:hypothetical protein
MSAVGVAAVTVLDNAAFELCKKGHYTRSLEKCRAAVVAAQALGFTDCLITACMQLDEINALTLHGRAPGVPADEEPKSKAASIVLLHSVIELLKRRKAAGTLLEGACRPEEVAFNASRHEHHSALYDDQRGPGAVPAKKLGSMFQPFIGYEVYLKAACWALRYTPVLTVLRRDVQMLVDFTCDAMNMMLQPRSYAAHSLSGEVMFGLALRDIIEIGACDRLEAKHRDALSAAWLRVQRSGVLQARRIAKGSEEVATFSEELRVKAVAQHASATLRGCALAACTAREVHASQFKRCSACSGVVYCSKDCQLADWPAHKAACKAARKAAAGAGPSGNE